MLGMFASKRGSEKKYLHARVKAIRLRAEMAFLI